MNSDDLLEALNLNDLNQNSGDLTFDDEPKQKEEAPLKKKNSTANKSSFKSNKSKPKRKPTQRPIINIDELLDGLDMKDDNDQPSATNIKPNSILSNTTDDNDQPIPTKAASPRKSNDFTNFQFENIDPSSSFTSRVELNIQSYLTTRFFNLRDDFVSELHRILIETDCIEIEVNKFINDLKINLRDILSFELQNINQINQVMSVVDTLCPAFLNVMKSIPNINAQDRQAETESANLAHVAVSTFSPVLQENFKTMADELSKNINSLHDLQSQIRKNEIKDEKQRRILKDTLFQYESKKITQQIESQTISDMSKRISEFQRIYSDHDDDDDDGFDGYGNYDSPHNRLLKKLRSAIIRLRKETEVTHMEPVSRIRAFRRKLNDYHEEASSMRNMILYNNQMFAQRSYQIMALSQPPPLDLMSQSQIINHPQQWQQQQSQNLSSSIRYPQQDQPRVSFPGIGEDLNTSINSSSISGNYQDKSFELIDNVRSRLRQIQDQHDADLENFSSFLQDLKKNEKQRVRAEIVNE